MYTYILIELASRYVDVHVHADYQPTPIQPNNHLLDAEPAAAVRASVELPGSPCLWAATGSSPSRWVLRTCLLAARTTVAPVPFSRAPALLPSCPEPADSGMNRLSDII